jgi:PAS domain S-box-containing protein
MEYRSAQENTGPDRQEELRFALEAAGIGTWSLDVINQVVEWDDRCKQLYGFSSDNVVPYELMLRYIHPEDVARVHNAIQDSLDPAIKAPYDISFRTIGAEDGQLRWLHCKGKAYFDSDDTAYRFAGIALDETGRVDAEAAQEVAQAETMRVAGMGFARLRELVNKAPVAMTVQLLPDLEIAVANDLMIHYWQKGRDVIGRTLPEVMPELGPQGIFDLMYEVARKGERWEARESPVTVMINKEPVTDYFNYSLTPLVDEDGIIFGILNMAQEVTDSVRARQRVEASEAKLRAIIESAPAAIGVFTGPDLIISNPNQQFIEVIGRGPALEGRPLAEVMPELEQQPFLEILRQVYRTGEPFNAFGAKLLIRNNDQLREKYFNVAFAPILDDTGAVSAILDISIDVTAQVLAQQALSEADASLRQAVEVAELGSWRMDLSRREISLSPRMSDWFGLEPGTAGFEAVLETVPAADRARVREALAKAIDPAGPGIYDVEHAVVSLSTGIQRILHAKGKTSFNADGQAQSIYGTTRDVTIQRQSQLALENEVRQRTEELAEANRALQRKNAELADANIRLLHSNEELAQYAYVASHDLQEPLRKIQVFTGMIRNAGAAGFDPLLLERVTQSAGRMSLLIQDLLSFSRLLRSEAMRESVDLNGIVRDVITDFELIIADKAALIDVQPLPAIDGIRLQLNQLFYNLIGNALKFSRAGVRPEISIRAVEATPAQVREHLEHPMPEVPYFLIGIQDNGIGFATEYSEQIFEVFKRLHTRDNYTGSGIGLSICRRIAANHQGVLFTESVEGEGSVFYLLLPARV